MKGEVPEDLTEEPPPPIPDRVDPPFHHKFKDAMNAAYRFEPFDDESSFINHKHFAIKCF